MPAPKQGGAAGRQWGDLKARVGPESWHLIPVGASQVDATLVRLLDRYRGPEPSDTVEMFEGEKFFAAFERGIDVDAGRSCFCGAREGQQGVTLWLLLLSY